MASIDDQGNAKGKERGDQGRLQQLREVRVAVTGHELE